MLRNVFLENEYRYLFVSQFKPKIIFDFEKNSAFNYSGAKLLLENGATQVIRCNEIHGIRQYSSKKIKNQLINFKLLNSEIDLKNQNIDTVLSFESIESKYFFNEVINEFYPILSKDGMFIISVFNSACIKSASNVKKGVTKKELEYILKQKFQNVKIYSQKKLTKNEIEEINSDLSIFSNELSVKKMKKISLKKKIRNTCANIFHYFDKTQTIYVKYFQKTVLKIDSKLEEKVEKSGYLPILSDDDEGIPLFYIAVCKK